MRRLALAVTAALALAACSGASGDPPVVARIANERVLIDLRTVAEEDDPIVAAALESAASGQSA